MEREPLADVSAALVIALAAYKQPEDIPTIGRLLGDPRERDPELVRLFRRDVLDDDGRALLRQYSPLYQAHKNMPPLLLINGTGERLWAQAQAFSRKLTEVSARHEVISLEGAPHGLENWEGHPEWTTYKGRLVEWIRRVTRFSR